MRSFVRCVSAEILKTRRTVYLLGVIVLPTILSLLNFLLMLSVKRPNEYASDRGWMQFQHNTITFWGMLVFPCVIVLVSAFSAHQEHDTKRWRTLMCLAVPRAALYAGKMAVVIGLAFLACLILWVENIFWEGLFSVLRPDAGLSLAHVNLWQMQLPFLTIFALSLLLVAIHFWFSLRVQNFVLSIGVGFVLSLIGAFQNDEPIWRVVFPWCLPSLVHSATSGHELIGGLLYGAAGFAIIAFLGCRDFVQRDVLA